MKSHCWINYFWNHCYEKKKKSPIETKKKVDQKSSQKSKITCTILWRSFHKSRPEALNFVCSPILISRSKLSYSPYEEVYPVTGVYFLPLTAVWVPPAVSVRKYTPVTGCIFPLVGLHLLCYWLKKEKRKIERLYIID